MPTREELAEVARIELAREQARSALLGNKEVPFVQRILNPNRYPVMKMGGDDATVQLGTHAYGPEETYKGVLLGGKEWVVPNIILGDDGRLVMRGPDDRLWDREQVARGNALPFDDAALAQEFAEGSWKQLIGNLIPRKTAIAPREPSSQYPRGATEAALTRDWAPTTPPVP